MKYYLIGLLMILFVFWTVLFSSCNCEDNHYKERRCRRIKDGVIKYITIERQYSPGDTIEYHEWSRDPYDLYIVLSEDPILKH